MVQLQLQVNKFTGSVPSMASSHNLLRINIAENFLGSGKVNGDDLSFLSTLTNARKLQALVINTNNFGGSLPEQIGNLSSSLEILVLDDNQILGSIPEGLRNMFNMQWFWADKNKLSGTTILSIIGNMQSLVQLRLDNNNIAGYIPLSIGNLDRLLVLRLANNHLEGEIPISIQNCRSMILLDLSNNDLSGVIPPQLMGLTSLSMNLNLSHNHFVGSIPIEVENLKNLGSLDLSYNMISNNIPSSLGKCVSLEFVQLQANLLRGTIPSSLDSLRGIRLFDVSSNNLSGQIPKFFEKMNSLQLLNLSYNKFEGEVPAAGVLIAAKVFNLQRRGASKSFMAECEALKNIRHINLVRILTVCSGVDYQGNDFKALVYEFVVNGSLENWLHPVESFDDPPKTLKFRQRVTIAINVASALDYIHNLYETPIVHCDIKPDNVLLDDHMVAHVGDFGLARFLESSSEKSSSIGIKGTVGYAPPEYGMGNEISVEGDMYSYGILLLEMFTRRRPIDESLKDGLNLHNFVNAALLGQGSTIAEVVDPTLLNELLLGRISEKALICMLEIGVACSFDSPQERLSISEVLSRLNKPLV
ncbi:unnamed protein product [Linum tenue]|uniref:non-specific serine/threonine protein kinase n=1 Tax=Linum tenue TaxID=586396 RepID=A0AAV0S1N1_9ROSI|nr:unnamed protein product [Linum tenue]